MGYDVAVFAHPWWAEKADQVGSYPGEDRFERANAGGGVETTEEDGSGHLGLALISSSVVYERFTSPRCRLGAPMKAWWMDGGVNLGERPFDR